MGSGIRWKSPTSGAILKNFLRIFGAVYQGGLPGSLQDVTRRFGGGLELPHNHPLQEECQDPFREGFKDSSILILFIHHFYLPRAALRAGEMP